MGGMPAHCSKGALGRGVLFIDVQMQVNFMKGYGCDPVCMCLRTCGAVGERSLLYKCVFATLVDLRDPRSMCSCVEGQAFPHLLCDHGCVFLLGRSRLCITTLCVMAYGCVCEGFLGSE